VGSALPNLNAGSESGRMRSCGAHKVIAIVIFISLLAVVECHAGMPSFTLREIYRLRFQELSFFIFLLFACALLFQLTWNYAVKGFGAIPKMNYWRALSLSFLLGLAMLLVLTMISGIREVLTPGAWRKQGSTYRLNDPAQEPARRRSIEHLRTALFEYARLHEGKFPPHDFVAEIPEKIWESPDANGTRYIYHGGWTTNEVSRLIAVEPAIFGEARFALTGNGTIVTVTTEELARGAATPK
jgi:hypothetical protein